METRLTQFLEHHPEAYVLREASREWSEEATDINMAIFQAEVAVRKHAASSASNGFNLSNLPDSNENTNGDSTGSGVEPASIPSIGGPVNANPTPNTDDTDDVEKLAGGSDGTEGNDGAEETEGDAE